jgi:anti-sigma B factor antagonist
VSSAIYDVDRDGAVVRVSGELDYAAKDVLQEALAAAAASSTDVVVDMRDTTFVDSTAVSVLISSRHAADARQGTLTILASTPVRRVLSILGLGEFLGIADVD